MKITLRTILIGCAAMLLSVSCKKEDEFNELSLSFKTDSGYTHEDATLATGTTVKIGIKASTTKKKDPIIKFSIYDTKPSGAVSALLVEDIEVTEYDYDYNLVYDDTVSGNKHKYSFTITNRDGIVAQKFLTFTTQ